LEKGAIPGGTKRNWDSYGHKIGDLSEYQRNILADPQTSGGLLVAVASENHQEFEDFAKSAGHDLSAIGRMVTKKDKMVYIK